MNISDFDKTLLSVLALILTGLGGVSLNTMVGMEGIRKDVNHIRAATDNFYTNDRAESDWRIQELTDDSQNGRLERLNKRLKKLEQNREI